MHLTGSPTTIITQRDNRQKSSTRDRYLEASSLSAATGAHLARTAGLATVRVLKAVVDFIAQAILFECQ